MIDFDVEIFDSAQKELIEGFLAFEGSFSEKAKFLGLNPSTDFTYADLRDADFSGANLKGYNFEHADLTSACGVNVEWDENTNFSEAILDYSIFAYSKEREKILEDNPFRSKYETLMESDDVTRSSFLLSGLDNPQSKDLAKLLVHDDEVALTQNTALYSILDIVPDEKEIVEYVKSLLNKRWHDAKYVSLFIQLIRRKLWKIPAIKTIVAPLILDPRPEVAARALAAFSKSHKLAHKEINTIVRGDRWYNHRRYFTLKNGINFVPARFLNVRKYSEKFVLHFAENFLDPKRVISTQDLKDLVIVPLDHISSQSGQNFEVVIRVSYNRNRVTNNAEVISDGKRRLNMHVENYKQQISSQYAKREYFAEVFEKSGVVYNLPKAFRVYGFHKRKVKNIAQFSSKNINTTGLITSKMALSRQHIKLPNYIKFY